MPIDTTALAEATADKIMAASMAAMGFPQARRGALRHVTEALETQRQHIADALCPGGICIWCKRENGHGEECHVARAIQETD